MSVNHLVSILLLACTLVFPVTNSFAAPRDTGSWRSVRRPGHAVRIMRGDAWNVLAVAFSPDGKRLASSGERDKLVVIWDVARARPIRMLPHAVPVRFLTFSPDARTIATGTLDNVVQTWDARTGQGQRTLARAWPVAFGRDGKTLITLAGSGIQYTDLSTARIVRIVKLAQARNTHSLAMSPDRAFLVIGEHNGASLYDVQRGLLLGRLGELPPDAAAAGYEFEEVAISPDGRWIATLIVQKGGTELVLWEVRRRTSVMAMQSPTGDGWTAGDLKFSPDSRTLAIADGAQVILKDVKTGALKATLPVGCCAKSLSYSPDGRILAIASGELVILWTLAGRQTR